MMAGYGHFLYTVTPLWCTATVSDYLPYTSASLRCTATVSDYLPYTVTPLRCTAARETNAHLLFQVYF